MRDWVLSELRENGFHEQEGLIVQNGTPGKDEIRLLHATQREAVLAREEHFIERWQSTLLKNFATGREVKPSRISPRVDPVTTEEQAALFRFATLHWSVPVSKGFGRRTRFLVIDDHNERLIGVFALGDPVYNLSARDSFVGWTVSDRNSRLYNVLDAFVLGAVPPYRQILGGKLVAMAAVSDRTREYVRRKYEGRETEIQGRVKKARPVLITTTSALGRSSLYNRLKYGERLLYQSVGYTRGFGHFQFSEPLFKALVDFLARDGGVPGYKFGEGPNWRIRTLRTSLSKLGLNPELLKHGVQREVFLAPLAQRWREYLLGETTRPGWYTYNLEDMAAFFRDRWAVPRAARDKTFRSVTRADSVLL